MQNLRWIGAFLVLLVVLITAGCGEKAEPPTTYQAVDSSLIGQVKYDAATQTLTIAFETGDVYDYQKVPQATYDDLMAAESKGKYFHAKIKDQYEYTKQ